MSYANARKVIPELAAMYAPIISLEIQKCREGHVNHVTVVKILICLNQEIVILTLVNASSVCMKQQETIVSLADLVTLDTRRTVCVKVQNLYL